MGNRYILDLNCAYCGEKNKEIWYAPTCGSDTFVCEHCKRVSFITDTMKSIKLEDIKFIEVRKGFINASNIERSKEEVDKICNDRMFQLREGIKNDY